MFKHQIYSIFRKADITLTRWTKNDDEMRLLAGGRDYNQLNEIQKELCDKYKVEKRRLGSGYEILVLKKENWKKERN
jgi:hypothetical protein